MKRMGILLNDIYKCGLVDWVGLEVNLLHINLKYVWKLAKHLKIKDIKTKSVKAFLKIMKPWVKQDSFRCVWYSMYKMWY